MVSALKRRKYLALKAVLSSPLQMCLQKWSVTFNMLDPFVADFARIEVQTLQVGQPCIDEEPVLSTELCWKAFLSNLVSFIHMKEEEVDEL
jgi:hypothetical protein